MSYAINQHIQLTQNCEVVGEYLLQGRTGTVIALTEMMGTPVVIVKFPDHPFGLPMWETEIESLEEAEP